MSQQIKIVAGAGIAALAIAAIPAAATHAADSNPKNATYTVSISEVLTLEYTAGTNSATVTNANKADNVTGGTLKVVTNNSKGYSLSVKDSDTNNALVSGTNTIAAGTSIDGTASNWALKASGTDATTAAKNWFAVPISTSDNPVVLAESSAPTADTGTTTTITYGVSVSSAQPAGTYTDTVTYTVAKKS